uniref:Selenoprotein P N-terminal domain-containing protein n=1 Tax=Romanomermis culicivorax TaxID=13658 RepID=A0A915JWU9_ROMCU
MKEHLGKVTLVALLELQCDFCKNQINSLERLLEYIKQHLDSQTRIVIIAPANESSTVVNHYQNSLATQGFTIVQESRSQFLWSLLGGCNNDFFIYDKCGRLNFHIPHPQSLTYYHYTINSLYDVHRRQSCGPCEHEMPDKRPNFYLDPSLSSPKRPQIQNFSVLGAEQQVKAWINSLPSANRTPEQLGVRINTPSSLPNTYYQHYDRRFSTSTQRTAVSKPSIRHRKPFCNCNLKNEVESGLRSIMEVQRGLYKKTGGLTQPPLDEKVIHRQRVRNKKFRTTTLSYAVSKSTIRNFVDALTTTDREQTEVDDYFLDDENSTLLDGIATASVPFVIEETTAQIQKPNAFTEPTQFKELQHVHNDESDEHEPEEGDEQLDPTGEDHFDEMPFVTASAELSAKSYKSESAISPNIITSRQFYDITIFSGIHISIAAKDCLDVLTQKRFVISTGFLFSSDKKPTTIKQQRTQIMKKNQEKAKALEAERYANNSDYASLIINGTASACTSFSDLFCLSAQNHKTTFHPCCYKGVYLTSVCTPTKCSTKTYPICCFQKFQQLSFFDFSLLPFSSSWFKSLPLFESSLPDETSGFWFYRLLLIFGI